MLHCRFDLYFLCNRVVFHGVGARFRVQVRGGGGGNREQLSGVGSLVPPGGYHKYSGCGTW